MSIALTLMFGALTITVTIRLVLDRHFSERLVGAVPATISGVVDELGAPQRGEVLVDGTRGDPEL